LLAYNIGIRAILYSKVSKKDTKGQVNLPSAKRRFEKKIIQMSLLVSFMACFSAIENLNHRWPWKTITFVVIKSHPFFDHDLSLCYSWSERWTDTNNSNEEMFLYQHLLSVSRYRSRYKAVLVVSVVSFILSSMG
jgi:hypothetical protein